jgi:hypothetical protein
MIDQKHLENMEYFNYFGSMVINDGRCTREIQYRIAMAEQLSTRIIFFHQKIGFQLKEETSKVLHLGYSAVRC